MHICLSILVRGTLWDDAYCLFSCEYWRLVISIWRDYRSLRLPGCRPLLNLWWQGSLRKNDIGKHEISEGPCHRTSQKTYRRCIHWNILMNLKKCTQTHIYIFTNSFTRARYDTGSIFKQSLTGLNSEFSFS